MSNGWPMVPLSELLKKSDTWVSIDPEQQYREVTVRLWGKGVVVRRDCLGAEIKADSRLAVKPNQFILSRIDARNGAFGLVPPDLDGAVVSSDFPVFDLDPNRLLPTYLGWLSKTADFVDTCRAASEGTTNRVRLKEGRFLAGSIPLPSLSEQRRIVARIEQLAAKIEEAQGLALKNSEAADSFIISLHLSLAKDRRITLAQAVRLDEQRVAVVPGREYPQVGIKGFGAGLFARPSAKAEETTYKYFNHLFDGALVLSQVKGWEGAIAVCDLEYAGRYASPEYRTFRCVPGESIPEYLRAIVKTPWFHRHILNATHGVGGRRERVRPELFLGLALPMPTIDLQREAVHAFDRLGQVPAHRERVAAELDALLPSILDRAFSGKLAQ